MDEHTKHGLDFAAIFATVGTLVELLRAIAALVSIVWGCIRIYETNTVQRLLKGRKVK
jgi:hypothetical protein